MGLKHIDGNATVAADADYGLCLFIKRIPIAGERPIIAEPYCRSGQMGITGVTDPRCSLFDP